MAQNPQSPESDSNTGSNTGPEARPGANTPTPPPARRLITIQVIRRQMLGVITARRRALQGGDPNRHGTPLDAGSPQVCTRLTL